VAAPNSVEDIFRTARESFGLSLASMQKARKVASAGSSSLCYMLTLCITARATVPIHMISSMGMVEMLCILARKQNLRPAGSVHEPTGFQTAASFDQRRRRQSLTRQIG